MCSFDLEPTSVMGTQYQDLTVEEEGRTRCTCTLLGRSRWRTELTDFFGDTGELEQSGDNDEDGNDDDEHKAKSAAANNDATAAAVVAASAAEDDNDDDDSLDDLMARADALVAQADDAEHGDTMDMTETLPSVVLAQARATTPADGTDDTMDLTGTLNGGPSLLSLLRRVSGKQCGAPPDIKLAGSRRRR